MIEVKRCEHSELTEAMKSQLADDYLDENDAPVGLYVVGWYDFKKTPKTLKIGGETYENSAEDWQKGFDTQAKSLSDHSRTVKAIVLNASLPANLRD